ncbi:MAG: hypothetical protein C4522_12125 [Desulfobacteraceae bacterium]|nr:MAG: hypothetical protein C4522_12125 [Desulfobacteraceae bacterium]
MRKSLISVMPGLIRHPGPIEKKLDSAQVTSGGFKNSTVCPSQIRNGQERSLGFFTKPSGFGYKICPIMMRGNIREKAPENPRAN